MTTDLPVEARSSNRAMLVPVISVEEHNEALIAVAWAIEHRGFPDAPAALLHIDHHADLDVPRVFTSLAGLPRTVEAIRDAVRNEISIASFIWAGAYLGILDAVYWLSPGSPFSGMRPRASTPPKRLFITTTDTKRREFLTLGQRLETEGVGNNDRQPLAVHFVDTTFRIVPRGGSQAWILGVDLDYFSCNSTPESGFRIQVTKAVHDAVRDDARHPLRLSVYHRVVPKQQAGEFWLEFDMFPPRIADPLVRTADEIGERIEALRVMLSELQEPPGLIVIARSRLSGFTPSGQWRFIEEAVLQMLSSIYICERLEGDSLW
jgi:hypothetical protein